jgi:hypothetical protein
MWRETLGCFKIITEDKKGYRNHPAVKEFEKNNYELFKRLCQVRKEMLNRGYHPKAYPTIRVVDLTFGKVKQWQTLKQQKEILKAKQCKCNI